MMIQELSNHQTYRNQTMIRDLHAIMCKMQGVTGYRNGRTPFGTTGNRRINRWRDGVTARSVLSLTTQYDDVKVALGRISGKEVGHCIRRFFQHNGGI